MQIPVLRELTSSATKAIRTAFDGYDARDCLIAIQRIDEFVARTKSETSLCAARKNLLPVKNLLQGVLDGWDELEAADLKVIRGRGVQFHNAFRADVKAAIQGHEAKTRSAPPKEAALQAPDEQQIKEMSLDQLIVCRSALADDPAVPRILLDNLDSAIQDLEMRETYATAVARNIESIGGVMERLPKRIGGRFLLIKAPILPLLKFGPDLAQTVRSSGIVVQEITTEYKVFMGQVLLAFPDQHKLGSSVKDALAANQKYVDDCLAQVNAGPTEYALISNLFVPNTQSAQNLLFAWLMPVATLNKLLQARIILKGWSFPASTPHQRPAPPQHQRPSPTIP